MIHEDIIRNKTRHNASILLHENVAIGEIWQLDTIFFICIVSAIFYAQTIKLFFLSKIYIENVYARLPVSMATNKMATV